MWHRPATFITSNTVAMHPSPSKARRLVAQAYPSSAFLRAPSLPADIQASQSNILKVPGTSYRSALGPA